ncbi:MAG TPA: carboxypeptidase-like regulatory domain-containing protein, partial [Mariprofundaceae bacterium]|nr:carboxypeptidase-like regulatory domain-containing protein [Mariprofundaceae bacterium]
WGYVGKDASTPAMFATVELVDRSSGKVVDEATTNFFGKYSFADVRPGKYIVRVGEIGRKISVKSGEVRLDIDLSAPGGRMDYSQGGKQAAQPAEQPASRPSGKAPAPSAAAPANNRQLMQDIAGTWWGYSGSTERSIGLCPDGSYYDSAESSYSGRGFDAQGNETMAWGSAGRRGGQGSWTIQGDYNAGIISVQYGNGGTATLQYRQIGDPGCLSFNGNTLCRKSKSCQ